MNLTTEKANNKNDPIMCDALKELMKPEIDEAVRDAIDQNRIYTAKRMIRKEKYSDSEIANISGLTVQQIQKIRNKMLTTA